MRGVLATKLADSSKPIIYDSVTNWRKLGRDEMARAAEASAKAAELKSEDTRIQAEAGYLRAIIALRDWQSGTAADGLTTAKSELETTITKDGSFAPAQYQLGVVKLYSMDLSGAESAFQNAVQIEPRWAVGYTRLGDVYREGQKYKEAIEAYRKAAEMDRTSAAAQAGLGLARALRGDKDGVKDIERAIQMDAASGIANFNLGLFFSTSKKSGELDRAIKELNTAIQKNQGNLEFQNSKVEQLIAEIQKKRKK